MLKNTCVTHVSEHLLPMSPVCTTPQGVVCTTYSVRPLTPIGHFARFAVKIAVKFLSSFSKNRWRTNCESKSWGKAPENA